MNVVKHIICELTGYRPGAVDVSQGDRGSRAVSCRLLENGAAWMIPEGATARVAYTLPDGTEGLYDRRPDGTPMWEISKNIVTVELADQLMAQAGMVQMSILVIGPEGGFEAEEIDRLREAGAHIATLGPRILRCETAPLVALSIVMQLTGNMN